MNINEIINISNPEELIRESILFLQNDYDETELKTLLNRLCALEFRREIESGKLDIDHLCALIREPIYFITVESGNMPELADLAIYNLFLNTKINNFTKAKNTLLQLQSIFESDTLGELEKLYMAILECYLGILDGTAKEALALFIRRISTLHLHEVSASINSDLVTPLFTSMDVKPDEFMSALEPLFELDAYFSLKPYRRRSIFNWCLHCFWQYPPVFTHALWPMFYDKWKILLCEHMARDEADQVCYLQFFIYHVMGNSFQEQTQWREFNDSISRKTTEYYIDWAKRRGIKPCKNEEAKDGKKLIGFLRDRLVENSPFKVEWSILEGLMKNEEFSNNYKVVIYNMDFIEKSDSDPFVVRMYADIGIPVVNVVQHLYTVGYYFSHIEKALLIREKIIADGVDILISPNNGYGISDFLVSTRCAPKQIFWCHGNFEYDVPNIDKRITHIGENSHMKQSKYEVAHFDYKTHDRFTKPQEEQYKAVARSVRAKYPADAIILGSMGRLVKVDSDEYLDAVSKIMQECPNSIYLACGGGNAEGIKEKLIKYNIDPDRFIFEGFVDPHVYGYVIDVYLNTFPEASGEAIVEFLEKNRYRFAMGYNHEFAKYGIDAKGQFVFDVVECCDIINKMTKAGYLSRFEARDKVGIFKPKEEVCESLKKQADTIRETIGNNKVVLGSVCHFAKVANLEFLEAVKEILARSKMTVYLLSGFGDDEFIRNFVSINDLGDRFIIDTKSDYHACLMAIDIVLNTFPYNLGALFEHIDTDKPIISLERERIENTREL